MLYCVEINVCLFIPFYRSSDYDSTSSDFPNKSVPSHFDFFSTSIYNISSFSNDDSFNNSSYVSNNSYTDENNASLIENYNSFPSLNKNNSSNNESISCSSTQVGIDTDIKNEDSESELVIESHINTPASSTQGVVHNAIECNVLEKASAVTETNFDANCEEYSSICEERKVFNSSVVIDDGDYVKKRRELLNEECVNLPFITENSPVLDWSVEVPDDEVATDNDGDYVKKREELLYEECVNLPFITEDTSVLDWTIEVSDEDVEIENKKIDTDAKTDDDDDDFHEVT